MSWPLVDRRFAPRDFGDDPLLMARRLNVPVLIGESRYAAGVLPSRNSDRSFHHLLDDGSSTVLVARDFDIVLVSLSAARRYCDRLLSRGVCAEAANNRFHRADAVVLATARLGGVFPLDQKAGLASNGRGFFPHRRSVRPILFSAIAAAKDFVAQLRTAASEPVA